MSKISTKFSFVGKVGVLFGMLIVGAYAKPGVQLADAQPEVVVPVRSLANEIDANSLIRTVSYHGNAEPVLRISKK